MAQWVKDPTLLQLWHKSNCSSNLIPGPGNFHRLGCVQKKKKKKSPPPPNFQKNTGNFFKSKIEFAVHQQLLTKHLHYIFSTLYLYLYCTRYKVI